MVWPQACPVITYPFHPLRAGPYPIQATVFFHLSKAVSNVQVSSGLWALPPLKVPPTKVLQVQTTLSLAIMAAAAAAAKSHHSCLTLCGPIDGSPPGFPVPGIL